MTSIGAYMRNDILKRKADVERWINENKPKAFICKQLKCKPITLEGYLQKMNLVYAGNIGRKGMSRGNVYVSAMEYATRDHVKTPLLRQKLIQDGLKKDSCELCGYSEWMGKKIPLELHHVDGNRFNNALNNLQILCPTCHSLTPNHSRKLGS
jgi:hypothetical protein